MEIKWTKVLVHASAFFLPLLVPILVFLISTDTQVKRLSIQALLFQFIMYVLIAIAGVLAWVLIGLPFLLIFWLMTWIVPIIGIIRALQDEEWDYPIVGRFL